LRHAPERKATFTFIHLDPTSVIYRLMDNNMPHLEKLLPRIRMVQTGSNFTLFL